ncbi:MAG: DNA recombination protein RmuC [Alphaproteobacteria bacterium]|nr:DNA recombination protein RmuC [Alphaproteobacteria bacterium]MCD8571609.1 DNA recombination protein RmuC [Alphaproteobacteria bacterium]
MEFLSQSFLFPAVLAFIVGAAISALFFMARMTKLERQNAELTVQIRNEKAALERAGAELDNRFKLTAQEALAKSAESFLQLAQEKLKAAQADGAHDMEKRSKAIETLVEPVKKQLETLSQSVEQIKGTDMNLRAEVQALSKETARLVGALRDPSAQGAWGEYILEGLLEKSGLMKDVHFFTQVSMETAEGRQRPDVVIKMQDGFNIIVDAKAPVNEFAARLSENLSEEDHTRMMSNLARQVRDHVKKLSAKGYWENIESVDFTVLFLPSEVLYSLALRADPDLVDFAARSNVIIASPTLLMSLLRVVAMSWRQADLAKNAADISALGAELYKRLLTFTDHIGKVGKNLQNAMSGYDAAVGSLEKSVLPSARKMHELQGRQEAELTELEPIERAPRVLSLTADDEEARKRA